MGVGVEISPKTNNRGVGTFWGGVKNSTIFFLVPMFITMFIRSNIILTTYIIKANVYIYVNLYVS